MTVVGVLLPLLLVGGELRWLHGVAPRVDVLLPLVVDAALDQELEPVDVEEQISLDGVGGKNELLQLRQVCSQMVAGRGVLAEKGDDGGVVDHVLLVCELHYVELDFVLSVVNKASTRSRCALAVTAREPTCSVH